MSIKKVKKTSFDRSNLTQIFVLILCRTKKSYSVRV